MPSGPGGELLPLDQHRIAPPFFDEMIKRRYSHDPAADHHHPRLRSHRKSLMLAQYLVIGRHIRVLNSTGVRRNDRPRFFFDTIPQTRPERYTPPPPPWTFGRGSGSGVGSARI